MVNGTGLYPRVGVEAGEVAAVGLAGAELLTETIRASGVGLGLSQALEPWRRDGAVHDPGKIICDPTSSLALGGGCVWDLALLRNQGEVFGPAAWAPTVWRLVGGLAGQITMVERAVDRARAHARAQVRKLAGKHAPSAGISAARPLVIDIEPFSSGLVVEVDEGGGGDGGDRGRGRADFSQGFEAFE